MIRDSVREVTDRAVRVTVSIPDGETLAAKTFNPKLGVRGGLSILGTTGRVRPFSCPALQESLRCALQVALALGLKDLVFVPGHIGEKAAHRHFVLRPEQVIEVSNEWGYMLGQAVREKVPRLLALGHPGKLAKLAEGMWDTHSGRSRKRAAFGGKNCRRTIFPTPFRKQTRSRAFWPPGRRKPARNWPIPWPGGYGWRWKSLPDSKFTSPWSWSTCRETGWAAREI